MSSGALKMSNSYRFLFLLSLHMVSVHIICSACACVHGEHVPKEIRNENNKLSAPLF